MVEKKKVEDVEGFCELIDILSWVYESSKKGIFFSSFFSSSFLEKDGCYLAEKRVPIYHVFQWNWYPCFKSAYPEVGNIC